MQDSLVRPNMKKYKLRLEANLLLTLLQDYIEDITDADLFDTGELTTATFNNDRNTIDLFIRDTEVGFDVLEGADIPIMNLGDLIDAKETAIQTRELELEEITDEDITQAYSEVTESNRETVDNISLSDRLRAATLSTQEITREDIRRMNDDFQRVGEQNGLSRRLQNEAERNSPQPIPSNDFIRAMEDRRNTFRVGYTYPASVNIPLDIMSIWSTGSEPEEKVLKGQGIPSYNSVKREDK